MAYFGTRTREGIHSDAMLITVTKAGQAADIGIGRKLLHAASLMLKSCQDYIHKVPGWLVLLACFREMVKLLLALIKMSGVE